MIRRTLEQTLEAFGKFNLANEVVIAQNGAEVLDIYLNAASFLGE